MIAHDIAARYSKALFKIAGSKEQLEKTLNDLEKIIQLFKDHPKLNYFIQSPQISEEEKKNAINSILGGKIEKTVLYFLFLLLDKGRFKYLAEITKSYHQMVKEFVGALKGRLITAIPIERETKDKLISRLEKIYGKKVDLKEEIDPKIIGGMIVEVDNQVMDYSIKNRLTMLREELLFG